jgi:hypothetical protein
MTPPPSTGKIAVDGPIRRQKTKRGREQIYNAAPPLASTKIAAADTLAHGDDHLIKEKEEDDDEGGVSEEKNEDNESKVEVDDLIAQTNDLSLEEIGKSVSVTVSFPAFVTSPRKASSSTKTEGSTTTTGLTSTSTSSSFFSKITSSISSVSSSFTAIFPRKKSTNVTSGGSGGGEENKNDTCLDIVDHVVVGDGDEEGSVEDAK